MTTALTNSSRDEELMPLDASENIAKAFELTTEANAALDRGDISQTHQLLAAAQKLSPRDPGLALSLGHVALHLGDHIAAFDAYLAAATIEPNLAEAHACCALVLQILNRSDDAEFAANRTLSIDPCNAVALKVLARIHINNGQKTMAEARLNAILSKNPRDTDALRMKQQAAAIQVKNQVQTPRFAPQIPSTIPNNKPLSKAPTVKKEKKHVTAQDYFGAIAALPESERTKARIFFDVGANNGHTSVPVAHDHRNTQVFAFEPTPEMIRQIESKISQFPNYTLTRKAVSNYEGKEVFKVAGQADWGCSSLLDFSSKSRTEWPGRTDFQVTEKIEVDVMRLDRFIEEQGIQEIDFLHIDTQGSDLNVLKGLGKYLSIVKQGALEAAARQDILYCGQNTQEESIQFLEENGFEILGIEINDDHHNEVNISFKRKVKIRQYIVTYNNAVQINNCLRSIFTKSSAEELEMLEIFVINNHSNIKIDAEFLPRIKLLNNALRPNFSTGHLARNWNQALINGFKDLTAPDCDLVITNQDDTLFVDNYVTKTLELHKKFDLLQFGWGDNFISYTPRAVRRIGLWDEKFCNIGYQEADYLTRAKLFLKEKASINDFSHKRMSHALDKSQYVIDIFPSGNARGEDYSQASMKFHEHSKFVYEMKWGIDPDQGWEGKNLDTLQARTQQFIFYPYFEKAIETLDEQNYLHRFPKNGKKVAKSIATVTPAPSVAKAAPFASPLFQTIRFADASNAPETECTLAILSDKCELSKLSCLKVSYQAAQFAHLEKHCQIIWRNEAGSSGAQLLSEFKTSTGRKPDAAVVFDEHALLTDPQIKNFRWDNETLMVYISHDFWCHPLRVAAKLRQIPRVLMVLRHQSALSLFDRLLPGIPKVVQRPGVETSIFHPHNGVKHYDVLLGGSETPDYPLRQRINRLVRENANRLGWKLLDLTSTGLMSNSLGTQKDYAEALAASKVSPTGSNRGGGQGCKFVTQYFDLSPARAQFQDEFYGLNTPELQVEQIDTAGITPRYLESLASKSLLIADLPPKDKQRWYKDKMAVIHNEMTDGELLGIIDHWVKNDTEREAVCERAWQSVLSSETSEHKAKELIQIIQSNL